MFFRSLFFKHALNTCLLFLPVIAWSDAEPCKTIAPGTIELKAAIDRALCLEPKIAESRAAVARSAGVVQEQRAASQPTLQAVVPASTSVQREDGRNSNSTSASASLNLQYLWLDGGARKERLNQRAKELEASEQDLIVQTQATVLDLVTLWADSLDALATDNAARAALTSARASLATAQARLQAGTGTRVDVLSAQSAAAQAARDLVVAQSSANQKLRTLAQRLELGADIPRALEPVIQTELVSIWTSDSRSDQVTSHPQLLAQRERVTAAQAAHEASKVEGGPTVSISAQAGPTWTRGNTLTSTTTTANRLSSEVGVTLTVPLSDGGTRKAKASQAKAQLDSERAKFFEIQRQLQESLETSRSNWESARADIESSQVALEAAVLAENSQRARFETGLGTLTELLTTQNDVATRAKQLSTAQNQLLRAAAQLGQARGVLHELFIPANPMPSGPNFPR